MRSKSGWVWLWVTAIILLLDRFSKIEIQRSLEPYSVKPIFPGFNLTLLYNKGAAFSLLDSQSGWQSWFLGAIALTVSIAILIWLYRIPSSKRWLSIALSLILGGALGNLSDRLLYGRVVDFLQFYAGNLYWPSFNIADSAVCVGAFMLFLDALFRKK